MAVPKYDEMFNPVLISLKKLGGSGTVSEIDEKVAEHLSLNDKDIAEIHRGNRTKLSYRLAWSRNYLKRYGLLENSERGVWSLTSKGRQIGQVNKEEVNKAAKSLDKQNEPLPHLNENEVEEGDLLLAWEEKLLEKLKKMPADAFERLCQRLLRESGFVEVQVTGRSGDGGIDGRGIYRINDLLSFRVIFQSKRYKDSVGSKYIREFKGTMSGRAEKGLFITTGTFTRESRQEAIRDGAAPIELIDGERLVKLMKDRSLGVKVSMQEVVTIDDSWFAEFST